jgi:sulfur relay (sulfurtransferase) complex TusBCD TusD component (DsrE family)
LPHKTVFIFSTNGLGQTDDAELKLKLAKRFLALLAETDPLPAQLCFYTDGVKLCVSGSPVLDELHHLAARGVELVICSTCVDTFGLREQVAVGVVGGMGDILAAMTGADGVVTL